MTERRETARHSEQGKVIGEEKSERKTGMRKTQGGHTKLSGWVQRRQKKANERAEKQQGSKGTRERRIFGGHETKDRMLQQEE